MNTDKKRDIIYICCTVAAIAFGVAGKVFLHNGKVLLAVLFFVLAFLQLTVATVNILLKRKGK